MMDIIVNRQRPDQHLFTEIDSGEVFRVAGGDEERYYMKLDADYYLPGDNYRHNAIRLANGKLVNIDYDAVVIVPSSRLVIDD